ncbi:MAG: hypothetical protein ACM3KE_01400, partial [Hyphomicrobiales bacterium]
IDGDLIGELMLEAVVVRFDKQNFPRPVVRLSDNAPVVTAADTPTVWRGVRLAGLHKPLL